MNIQKITIVACMISIMVFAQTDTITPLQQKLLIEKLTSSQSNYLVHWEDANGNISGGLELWKRELKMDNNEYRFDWKWYKMTSLWTN